MPLITYIKIFTHPLFLVTIFSGNGDFTSRLGYVIVTGNVRRRSRKKAFLSEKRQKLFVGAGCLGALFIFIAMTQGSKNAAHSSAEAQLTSSHFENPSQRELSPSFKATFEQGHDNENWYISNFTIEGGPFRNGWSKDNVIFQENGDVALVLTHDRSGKAPYMSGEYQRRGWVQYGKFEVIMKSAPGSGTVGGFFTHTNDYFGDPHDEIDIEFLGKNTRMVQFNVHRDGKAYGGQQYPLPYDASEEFHLYAFEWRPESIDWYVDGEHMFSLTDQDFDIPDTPQRLIAQLWTGEWFQWHGEPRFPSGVDVVLRCISYQSLDDTDSPACSDTPALLNTSSAQLATEAAAKALEDAEAEAEALAAAQAQPTAEADAAETQPATQ